MRTSTLDHHAPAARICVRPRERRRQRTYHFGTQGIAALGPIKDQAGDSTFLFDAKHALSPLHASCAGFLGWHVHGDDPLRLQIGDFSIAVSVFAQNLVAVLPKVGGGAAHLEWRA
jgi:hypothetical protein